MADVQTTDINTKPTVTAIDSNDQIYISDGGTALKKISYTNLAKAIIEQYNASQLAGATKTIQSAFNELNSKPTVNAIQKSNISLDTLTTPGVYACNNCTETPNGLTRWFNVRVLPNGSGGNGNTDYAIQIAIPLSSNEIYIRHRDSGTWYAWEKLPTRAEIDALNSKSVGDNAGGHNSIFRGKSLGSSVSAAQWSAISSGTFDDLFIGDYWTINSITWRIAAFNYWYNTGDTNCTTPHVVIVPDSNLLNGDKSTTHWMNTSNTTEGGYMGTGWYTGENADGTANTGKSQCLSKAESAFGSGHILQHREYLSNAVANGYVSGGTWADSKIELMNESMVYGNRFFENVINGTNIPVAYTVDKGQLPLFALAPQYICNRANWWLRSVVSSTHFATVNGAGTCTYAGASNTWDGLRPAFGIK